MDAARWVLLALSVVVMASCSDPEFAPLSPHETLLGITTEYKLLEAEDAYRDPPGRDLTGQSIARVTLVRLANYEQLHGERFAPEIAVLKARCYERLGELDTARALYARVAAQEGEDSALAMDSERRIALLDRILAVRDDAVPPRDFAGAVQLLELQGNAWRRVAEELADARYAALALVEAEQADVRRAELLARQRWMLADGEAQAEKALSDLVRDHANSRRALEHALRLARFHRELAEEEAALNPPESLDFNSERFEHHLDEALEIAWRVSREDGSPERLVAAREVDALLALREWVAERAY